mgnify:CR=1 FL=1
MGDSQKTFDHLLLADREPGKGADLARVLESSASATGLDVCDEDEVITAVGNAKDSGETVVLNASGPFTQSTIGMIKAVLRFGVSYADVNDETSMLSEVLSSGDLNTVAYEQGVAVLPGLGVSPGQTNVVARYS